MKRMSWLLHKITGNAVHEILMDQRGHVHGSEVSKFIAKIAKLLTSEITDTSFRCR